MNEQQMVIYEIQKKLRNISKVNSDIPSIAPDGIYGEKSREAVKAFQKINNLKETGTVDFLTWKSLSNKSKEALFIMSEPIQVTQITNSDLPLVKGDIKKAVYTLKLMLSEIAETFDNFNKLEINNFFDELTEKEVIRWQKVIDEPQTGSVDKKTWNMLAEYYLLKEETP